MVLVINMLVAVNNIIAVISVMSIVKEVVVYFIMEIVYSNIE